VYLETTISGHFVWSKKEGILVKESKGESTSYMQIQRYLNKYIETRKRILMDLTSIPCVSFV